ncbi:MAG: hypothetical protein ACRDDH_00540 [Cetobacterium sp.]|uniref:hypothetical protein n=1 Tax=Cetobacterium sp. TaxID=2071632 RepID=UPI003EE602FF
MNCCTELEVKKELILMGGGRNQNKEETEGTRRVGGITCTIALIGRKGCTKYKMGGSKESEERRDRRYEEGGR